MAATTTITNTNTYNSLSPNDMMGRTVADRLNSITIYAAELAAKTDIVSVINLQNLISSTSAHFGVTITVTP
jgi:hypothetical protein